GCTAGAGQGRRQDDGQHRGQLQQVLHRGSPFEDGPTDGPVAWGRILSLQDLRFGSRDRERPRFRDQRQPFGSIPQTALEVGWGFGAGSLANSSRSHTLAAAVRPVSAEARCAAASQEGEAKRAAARIRTAIPVERFCDMESSPFEGSAKPLQYAGPAPGFRGETRKRGEESKIPSGRPARKVSPPAGTYRQRDRTLLYPLRICRCSPDPPHHPRTAVGGAFATGGSQGDLRPPIRKTSIHKTGDRPCPSSSSPPSSWRPSSSS